MTPRVSHEPARIAVVGLGAVTALGPTADDLWAGARSGRVAIRPVQRISMAGYRTKLAGEVDVVPDSGHRRQPGAPRDRALDLAIAAAEEALAVLPDGLVRPERFGVVLGTCNAGLLSAREWLRDGANGGAPRPELVRLVTPQALAESLATGFRLGGPVLAVNTACASGANAIGLAADLVRAGRADAVLAGGTEALSDVVIAGFNALESLSCEPARPYARNRAGLSLGEGSGMVVLMRADLAADAGLPVLAEVLGYGLSADAYHPTAPRPDGAAAARAMSSALRGGGVRPAEVGYINGHGTGTRKNDSAETRAIRLALGSAAEDVLVSSTKSVIGHLLGAAGAVEAIVTIRALAAGIAPPTAGHPDGDDPECDLDYVADGPRRFRSRVALSNSFAFGGANASLALGTPGVPGRPSRSEWDRVVITGMAVLSSAGNSPEQAWLAFADGRDCCRWEEGRRLGRVDVDPEPYLSRRQRRRMDRLGVLSVVSSAKALSSAGFDAESDAAAGIGVLFGTGVGPMETMERFVLPLLADASAAEPGRFPNTVYNQAAGHVATQLGLRGPTSTLSVGHATGAAAVAYSADLLATGHADAMLAVVTDTLTDKVVDAYAAQEVFASGGGDRPAGFGLAEASVALVLERRGAAVARGATILGEVLGTGMASDLPRARSQGMERAMRDALERGGVAPDRVSGVWLSACGLSTVDRAERRAVRRVLPALTPTYAPKMLLGEPMGVGGALNLALALADSRSTAGGSMLVNSSSLGGTHISVLIEGRDRHDTVHTAPH